MKPGTKKIIEAKSPGQRNFEIGRRRSSSILYIRNQAKQEKRAKKEKEKLIKKGYQEAEDIKSKAKKNIAKANKFILTEFERAANA